MIFHGWFIVAAGFLILLISWGIIFSFSVFLIPLIEQFGWSRASTAGVFSLMVLLFGVGSIFSGRLAERYGPRVVNILGGVLVGGGLALSATIQSLWQLYVFYGLIIGLGVSTSWTPLVAVVARWFVARRGLAMGVMSIGNSIGMILFPPISRYLITIFGWRWSFLILGVLSGATIIAAALFLQRDPQEKNVRAFGESPPPRPPDQAPPSFSLSPAKDLSYSQALVTSPFWMIAMGYLLWLTGFLMVSVHLAAYGVQWGLSPMAAAFAVSLIGAGSIFGKISLGLLSDRIGPQKVLALGLLMQGTAVFGLIGSRSAVPIYLCAAVIGFGYGGTGPQLPVLTAKLFGLSALGSIFGTLVLSGQFGGAIGPFLAGKMFDLTQSYLGGFSLGGISVVVAALLLFFIKPPRINPPETS